MKKYFIGGLGSNVYHSKDFLQELNSQIYFLNPYEKHLRDETELKSWFKNEIVEEESICLIGHSLGGDLSRYLAEENLFVLSFYLLKHTIHIGIFWFIDFGKAVNFQGWEVLFEFFMVVIDQFSFGRYPGVIFILTGISLGQQTIHT